MTHVRAETEPREHCPTCGALLYHESRGPLEEYCIESGCDYYRAEIGDEELVRK